MYLFWRTKKGFTLVELMIVVVIMAILVAVAVPIYSAVTGNSRKKTCTANQHDLLSVIDRSQMNGKFADAADGDRYSITTNAEGDGELGWVFESGTGADNTAELKALFQNQPYCPTKNAKLTVVFEALPTAEEQIVKFRIKTGCSASGHESDLSA